jgi:hypothetical protein
MLELFVASPAIHARHGMRAFYRSDHRVCSELPLISFPDGIRIIPSSPVASLGYLAGGPATAEIVQDCRNQA